jgi:hypothetical protein
MLGVSKLSWLCASCSCCWLQLRQTGRLVISDTSVSSRKRSRPLHQWMSILLSQSSHDIWAPSGQRDGFQWTLGPGTDGKGVLSTDPLPTAVPSSHQMCWALLTLCPLMCLAHEDSQTTLSSMAQKRGMGSSTTPVSPASTNSKPDGSVTNPFRSSRMT